MTVGELLEALEGMDADVEVRLATQPAWPLQYGVNGAVAIIDPDTAQTIVYLGEGDTPTADESPYVPAAVADALWGEQPVRTDCPGCDAPIVVPAEPDADTWRTPPYCCGNCGGSAPVSLTAEAIR